MSYKDKVMRNLVQETLMKEFANEYEHGDSGNATSLRSTIKNYIDENYNDPDKLKELLESDDTADTSELSPKEKLAQLQESGIELSPSWKERLITEGLPIAGDVAKVIGTGYSARNMMLAKALQNASNISASNSQRKYYGATLDDIAAATQAPALEYAAIMSKTIGDTASDRLEKVASNYKQDKEKERALKYQTATEPTGEFYRYMSKMTPSQK